MSVTTVHDRNKTVIHTLRAALYDLELSRLEGTLGEVFAADAKLQLAFPFEDLAGPGALFEVYKGLARAVPDLERRDTIVIAGAGAGADLGGDWVGCAGFYTGVFEEPWLDIPSTQQPVTMRFHEFFRLEAGRVVEMQALWDLPEVMLQASAWPMSPSLGAEGFVPGPATQNGLVTGPYDADKAAVSRQLVADMLSGLQKHREHGVAAMGLADYWHPKMTWYGPAGIGTNRGVAGFRSRHQIPFLRAMPDREVVPGRGVLFGDGDYVGYTGWPGMAMTLSGDGWLGIAPTDKAITMRSLDFWRCEAGRIRENWVLIDLLHVYDQLGVDVFSRMREFTHARQPR